VATMSDPQPETKHRLFESDAKLIFGILAVVSGELYGGDAGTLGASIRARLSMDGAISSPESMGEAASVLERLGQQMLYGAWRLRRRPT